MTKAELRKKYILLRAQLSASEKIDSSLNIANNLLELPIWHTHSFHVFLSIDKFNEVNTEPIMSILHGKDKNIVVSKSNLKDQTMRHYLLTDNTKIEVNSWSIPEPVDGIELNVSEIDVVIVPLLAFDKHGQRVGYGKGYYDKFLSSCRPDTLKIGVSFFESEDLIKDHHVQDVALNYCVTPKGIYRF
ncbi:MAG: 5-formyltetrahydrofolate cyclo-ligase [Bacteroidia bacterium]|nr:5-formyltetrahydrofolate cyclo-ligase [Bacteroidia bacterium]NND25473.1 5-formyltetrahydrofolate cyclo-ligase [Flavobacteriaceae bacterium]NNL31952.1 5-formyltetrahydrofolate cyclo-ligase [Flavobacteriaceae bacterium]